MSRGSSKKSCLQSDAALNNASEQLIVTETTQLESEEFDRVNAINLHGL